jgi:hypothetical protein
MEEVMKKGFRMFFLVFLMGTALLMGRAFSTPGSV